MTTTAAEFQSAKHAGLKLAGALFGKPIWKGEPHQFFKFDCDMQWYRLLGWNV